MWSVLYIAHECYLEMNFSMTIPSFILCDNHTQSPHNWFTVVFKDFSGAGVVLLYLNVLVIGISYVSVINFIKMKISP